MSNKELALKLMAGKVDLMLALAIESVDIIYNAAYNEAIEDAANLFLEDNDRICEDIRKLKK